MDLIIYYGKKNVNILKPTILCFSDFYLPGFKSGGLVRSISNFVETLGDQFHIKIICRNCDTLDASPYKNIKVDTWNIVGKAKVFYASSKSLSFFSIATLITETPHNILYLNSVFSFRFSILPLLVKFFFSSLNQSCIISPRGELSEGALSLKKLKKYLFIRFAKYSKLHCNLFWLASCKRESLDIYKTFGKIVKKVEVIPDEFILKPILKRQIPKKKSKILRIIFLSRISPMKNLDYLLHILSQITEPLEINIFGPIEDKKYWKKCRRLIHLLPDNIKVNIGKEIKSNNVQNVFFSHDLFVFPTKGENFGHVILESLSASTPVLLSDQTMWQSDKKQGLIALPLNQDIWIREIKKWSKLNLHQYYNRRKASLELANKKIKYLKKKSDYIKKFFFKIL